MQLDYATTIVAASILVFVVLFVLLAVKRLRRDRAEREQQRRLALMSRSVTGSDVASGALASLEHLVRARPVELVRMDRIIRQFDPTRLELLRELMPPDLREALAERLAREALHRDPPRRGIAALLTARLGLPGAAALLAPMLDDDDRDVAQSACRALGILGDSTGARALVAALDHGRVPTERLVESLISPTSTPALIAALADPGSRHVHRHIVRAVGLIGDTRAEEALLAAAEGADDDLHVAICRALGTAGTDHSTDHLLEMLRHDAWPVRAQAATALSRRTPTPAVVEALEVSLGDAAWWVRANAADALGRLGGVGIAGLIRATRHADRYARARAEETLALIALKGATV